MATTAHRREEGTHRHGRWQRARAHYGSRQVIEILRRGPIFLHSYDLVSRQGEPAHVTDLALLTSSSSAESPNSLASNVVNPDALRRGPLPHCGDTAPTSRRAQGITTGWRSRAARSRTASSPCGRAGRAARSPVAGADDHAGCTTQRSHAAPATTGMAISVASTRPGRDRSHRARRRGKRPGGSTRSGRSGRRTRRP
jgi:hypothetical protein